MIPYSGALNPNRMESMHLALAHTETVERWRSALRMGRVNLYRAAVAVHRRITGPYMAQNGNVTPIPL